MTRPPNPAWRVPSRPCPFYSQGKCLFSDACNFVHDVKITATPIKSAGTAVMLPQISYTSPLSEHHPEPVIVTSNPFLGDEPALERSQAIAESPETFHEAEQVDNLKAASPIQLSDEGSGRVNRYLGLPGAPLYLNELKNYHRKHHLLPSPNTPLQELSRSAESNGAANMSLRPIEESSLMQSRRAAQDDALNDLHTDETENSSSLGLSNMEHPAEVPLQLEPLTSTPRKERGLRPLRLPALHSEPQTPATPVQLSGQLSPTHESVSQEPPEHDPTASLIPSPIGPFGLDNFKNMGYLQSHTMTTSEFDRGRKDVEGGVLEEPKSDLDTPTFSDDTAASGSFDMSGNTSILDGIYGPNEPSGHPHQATQADTTPALSSLSMSTSESELTTVIDNRQRFSVTTDPGLPIFLPFTPTDASALPNQEAVRPHHSNDLANPPLSSRPASRGSTPASPLTEAIQWNGRVTSISSSEDMYRRLSTASSLERTRHMPSLVNILGAIDEAHEHSAAPPLRFNRPSSQATSARAPTPSERARSVTAISPPPLSGTSSGFLPTARGRGSLPPSRRLTIQTTTRRHDPSPAASHSPSTAVSTMSSAPHLFFALASDSPFQVSNILTLGQANPNDTAGPDDLPALVFSLTNDRLKNKTEIVKTLLSHGADPSVVQHLVPPRGEGADSHSTDLEDTDDSPLAQKLRGSINPAIEYYLGRQNATTQKQVEALQEGHYDPLLRARFHIVGQDLALDEMMRSVASHSRRKGSVASLALVLTGPSGHGKSHLASKIGTLLQSPLYIVNMTNLRTQEDLMRAQSLARESDESHDLLSFLKAHEGKRCVVVLEEIEKTAEKQVLHSLLMPWELGKVPASPVNPVIDTSEVIWVCTSNSGEGLVFEFSRDNGTKPSSREQYKKLMSRMRARLADELGASIISRVQGVLPFLPFTYDEQRALASEMLDKLTSQCDHSTNAPNTWLTTAVANEIVDSAIQDYIEREGARSIHRAVQELYEEKLMDT